MHCPVVRQLRFDVRETGNTPLEIWIHVRLVVLMSPHQSDLSLQLFAKVLVIDNRRLADIRKDHPIRLRSLP